MACHTFNEKTDVRKCVCVRYCNGMAFCRVAGLQLSLSNLLPSTFLPVSDLFMPFFQDALLRLASIIDASNLRGAIKETLEALLPKVVGTVKHKHSVLYSYTDETNTSINKKYIYSAILVRPILGKMCMCLAERKRERRKGSK